MVDDFDEKLRHKERTLRKDGLNMTVFNRRLKSVNVFRFVNVYMVPALVYDVQMSKNANPA